MAPSLRCRTGEMVKSTFISGCFSRTKATMCSKEAFISSKESSFFLKIFWGCLWQLATILPVSKCSYTQAVPKVITIRDVWESASCREAICWFSWAKSARSEGFAHWECSSKDSHRSSCRKKSASVKACPLHTRSRLRSMAKGWKSVPKGWEKKGSLW